MKSKYKWQANWFGETLEGYTEATNEKVAHVNVIMQIANIVQRTANMVYNHLSNKNEGLVIIKIK